MSIDSHTFNTHIHTVNDDLQSILLVYLWLICEKRDELSWIQNRVLKDYDLGNLKFSFIINFENEYSNKWGCNPIHVPVLNMLSKIMFPGNLFGRYRPGFGGPGTDFSVNSPFSCEVRDIYQAFFLAFAQKPQAPKLDEKDNGLGALSFRQIRF